jgi:hypothetical protein
MSERDLVIVAWDTNACECISFLRVAVALRGKRSGGGIAKAPRSGNPSMTESMSLHGFTFFNAPKLLDNAIYINIIPLI